MRLPSNHNQEDRFERIRGRRWVLLSVAACAVIGCGAKAPSYSEQYKTSFEKRTGADEWKARAFVKTLATIPPGERKAYVLQHSADAKNLALIPDQDLQAKYKDIMLSGK